MLEPALQSAAFDELVQMASRVAHTLSSAGWLPSESLDLAASEERRATFETRADAFEVAVASALAEAARESQVELSSSSCVSGARATAVEVCLSKLGVQLDQLRREMARAASPECDVEGAGDRVVQRRMREVAQPAGASSGH